MVYRLLHLCQGTRAANVKAGWPVRVAGASPVAPVAAEVLHGLMCAAVLPWPVWPTHCGFLPPRPPLSKPRLHESHGCLSQLRSPPLKEARKGEGETTLPRNPELAGIQPLLKALTDPGFKGCRFWPVYIFSHSFCNNKAGESQGKKLVVSMKKGGLVFQDLFALRTKPTSLPPPGCNISW